MNSKTVQQVLTRAFESIGSEKTDDFDSMVLGLSEAIIERNSEDPDDIVNSFSEISDRDALFSHLQHFLQKNLYDPSFRNINEAIYNISIVSAHIPSKLIRHAGELALFVGNYQIAHDRLELCLTRDENDYWAMRLLGVVLMKMNRHRDALAALEKVSDKFSDDRGFLIQLDDLRSQVSGNITAHPLLAPYIAKENNVLLMAYEHIDQFIFWSKIAKHLGIKLLIIKSINLAINPPAKIIYDPNIGYYDIDNDADIESKCYIIVPSFELEDVLYDFVGPKCKQAFFLHVMGNNVNEGGKGKRAKRRPQNLVACDIQSADYWIRRGTKNVIYLYPFVSSDFYDYHPIDYTQAPNINCYIQNFYNPHAVNSRYIRVFHEIISEYFKDRIVFNVFGSNNPGGMLTPDEEKILGDPGTNATRWQSEAIRDSYMTIHIKKWEGFGYNVMKSLSIGRPIISMRNVVHDKTLSAFCIDGFNSLIGEEEYVDELIYKIAHALDNKSHLNELSSNSAKHVRQMCDFERDAARLARFLIRCEPQPAVS